VKEEGFELGVKSEGVIDGESGESTKERRCGRSRKTQVRHRETGMTLTERSRELIPETDGAYRRNDQLYVTRTMLVVERE